MMLEQGFAQIAQALLWPVLVLVGLGFIYALWVAGATLMEAAQRWRSPNYRTLQAHADKPLEEIELQVVRQLEPLRLLGRVSPLLGLIATMVPLGPALQSVAAGQGQQALAVFSGAFAGVVLALAAAAVGLVAYSVRRRWLMAELVSIRSSRGLA
ncbi:MotA/TolQ/ExbB proton channel family protein [Paucibacter sp. O1-1]|nr:MotA/TolQ/ExbB proton channel family protein [Paucibacter sp. O1-1]MDA3827176.1 MotA/TolQ/ExbB proton channel family protein [Paucibacter sp. O1-1]